MRDIFNPEYKGKKKYKIFPIDKFFKAYLFYIFDQIFVRR